MKTKPTPPAIAQQVALGVRSKAAPHRPKAPGCLPKKPQPHQVLTVSTKPKPAHTHMHKAAQAMEARVPEGLTVQVGRPLRGRYEVAPGETLSGGFSSSPPGVDPLTGRGWGL